MSNLQPHFLSSNDQAFVDRLCHTFFHVLNQSGAGKELGALALVDALVNMVAIHSEETGEDPNEVLTVLHGEQRAMLKRYLAQRVTH